MEFQADTFVQQYGAYFTAGGLLMGIIGYLVAATKGNGCWGCGLGCLLGPVGIIIALLIPPRRG